MTLAREVTISFLIFFGVASISGCNPCREEVWSRSLSPDGKWVAVTVMRDCGATTAEVVSLNIHTIKSDNLKASNNALVVKHGHTIDATWISSTELRLECTDCSNEEILANRNQIGIIKIIYDKPHY
jgi:hypothetical protein